MLYTEFKTYIATASRAVRDGLFKEARKTYSFLFSFVFLCLFYSTKINYKIMLFIFAVLIIANLISQVSRQITDLRHIETHGYLPPLCITRVIIFAVRPVECSSPHHTTGEQVPHLGTIKRFIQVVSCVPVPCSMLGRFVVLMFHFYLYF